MTLRKQEDNRQDNVRLHQKTKPKKTENDDMETGEPTLIQSKKIGLMDELTDVLNKNQTSNGSEEADHNQESPKTSGSPPKIPRQEGSSTHKVVRNNIPMRHPGFKGHEWIEMGIRREKGVKQLEDDKKIVETQMTNTQSLMWKRKEQFVPRLNNLTQNEATGPGRYNPNRKPSRLIHELPDVDYPTEDEEISIQVPHEPIIMSRQQPVRPPVEKQVLRRSNSDIQLVTHSEDTETHPDAGGFPQNLKSPGLRKRRPGSTSQGPPTPTPKQFLHEPTQTLAAPNSSLNSNSEYSSHSNRYSLPTKFDLDAQQGLNQRSSKSKTPKPYPRYSSDVEAFSESELPGTKFHIKKSKFKDFRSSSSPNVLGRGGQGLLRPSDSSNTTRKEKETPSPANIPNENASRLMGVLERAKERDKDKGGIKKDKQLKTGTVKSRYLRPSSPFNNIPSPTPSEGGNETDVEEVALIRPRVLTVSAGWKEQLVDGDEDDKSSGLVACASSFLHIILTLCTHAQRGNQKYSFLKFVTFEETLMYFIVVLCNKQTQSNAYL